MSTAIAPAPLASKINDKVASVSTVKAAEISIGTIPPDNPIAPTVQDVLSNAPTIQDATPTVLDATPGFEVYSLRLANMIQTQSRAILGYYIERGDLVRDAIDSKLKRATNKATRVENRASAIKSLTATAQGAYDPSCEPSPKLDLWISLSALAKMFPATDKLPSVRVASALATTLTRVDPPATWDAPDTWVLKSRFRPDDVANLIVRAQSESMTYDTVIAEIEKIGGRVLEDPAVSKSIDTTANADALAKRVMDSILENEIDPARFVASLQTALVSHGYSLAPGHDDRGVSTYKLVKGGR